MNLSSLRLDHNGVMDLTPLEHCEYLSSLTLKANYVSDVTPLSKLKHLYELRLDDNPIEDISMLEDMENYDNRMVHIQKLSFVLEKKGRKR